MTDAWERFEVFEALHHRMQICNPMTSAELDALVRSLPLTDGTRVLDVACGYGELLIRSTARAAIDGIGIDLSPWMIVEAHHRAVAAAPRIHLVLGEARDFVPDPLVDVAVCIGAEWVWHDFAGTVRALLDRIVPGGTIVVGAARLHTAADQDQVRQTHGVIRSIDDLAATLESHGLHIQHRIDPDDAGWDEYLEQTRVAAQAWAAQHPGPRAARWLVEQADWQAARERDREIIGWSVWVARAPSPTE